MDANPATDGEKAAAPAVSTTTFKRPARANTRTGAGGAPTEQAAVALGFRTHIDAVSGEEFLFSYKTIPHAIPKASDLGASECILELFPAAQSATGSLASSAAATLAPFPRSQSTLDVPQGQQQQQNQPAHRGLADRHPQAWICRAFCGGDKHVQHAAGALSVHQRLMDIKFLSDAAKGKAWAKVLTFAEAQQRHGLSHVELIIQDQFVSRSDMFLIMEALLDRILYLGQEITYEGFRLRVSDLLRAPHHPKGAGGKEEGHDRADTLGSPPATASSASASAQPPTATSATASTLDRSHWEACPSGVVTSSTKVNFLSLSFVYTILVDVSCEMWNPTIDASTAWHWALSRFLREHADQLPKYRSFPAIRLVFFGRLRLDFCMPDGGQDVYHMVTLPGRQQDIQRLPDIAKGHFDLFVEHLLSMFRSETVVHPQQLLVSSRQSNFLQALNLALEYYSYHHFDRRLDTTGQAITLLTAGNGLLRVTNDMAQITSTKMLDTGIRKCAMVCMGRPPLHAAPLFEYCSDDLSLRSQYHLPLDSKVRDRFYEQPEWITCLYYHPLDRGGARCGTAQCFGLLTKQQWEAEFPYIAHGSAEHLFHPGLAVAQLPEINVKCREAPLQALTRQDSQDRLPLRAGEGMFLRHSEPTVSSLGVQALCGLTPSKRQYTLSGALTSLCKHYRVSGHPLWLHATHSAKSAQLFGERNATAPPFVHARWLKHRSAMSCVPQQEEYASIGSNILDSDLAAGNLKLELSLDWLTMGSWQWNPKINQDRLLWEKFLRCFESRADCFTLASSPSRDDGNDSPATRFDAKQHFSYERTIVCGRLLMMFLLPAPKVQLEFPEELMLSFDPDLVVSDLGGGGESTRSTDEKSKTTQPVAVCDAPRATGKPCDETSSPGPSSMDMSTRARCPAAGTQALIGSIQIRSSILFAITPVNPYRGLEREKHQQLLQQQQQASLVDVYVTAGQVQMSRWQNAHPVSATQSIWATLCRVPIMPIYGQKTLYSTNTMNYSGHRTYWISTPLSQGIPLLLKEFVLQRLHQQYQLVVGKHHHSNSSAAVAQQPTTIGSASDAGGASGIVTVSTATGSSWSRHLQPLEEIEVSIGHQTQTLTISEDGRGVTIKRWLHRGLYESNIAHLVPYRYHLLHAAPCSSFNVREVRFEALFGRRYDYPWHRLDEYLCTRDGEIPNFLLKDRELCFVLLPAVASPLGDAGEKPRVPFGDFKDFVTSRFSTKLKPKEGADTDDLFCESKASLCFNKASSTPTLESPTGSEVPKELPIHTPSSSPMLRTVVLEHCKDDPGQCPDVTLRRPVDPLTGKTRHTAYVDDRLMGADIDLSPAYHEECAYVMRLSWLCCAATIIGDWTKGLQLNASRYALRVVQVPCVYDVMNCGNLLTSWYAVELPPEVDDGLFRAVALRRLASSKYMYFPEVHEMNMHCRLHHVTGLCFVLSLPDRRGLVWCENYLGACGTVHQVRLLQRFQQCVQESLVELAGGDSS